MALPATMRCILVREPGGPDVLEPGTCEVPQPRAGEVLVLNDNFCVRINEIVQAVRDEGN